MEVTSSDELSSGRKVLEDVARGTRESTLVIESELRFDFAEVCGCK